MYVDESGDTGLINSPTTHYILSSIIVHETKWLHFLNELIEFRRWLKKHKKLMMKEEIHASEFVSKRIKLKNKITPSDRVEILKLCLEWLSKRNYIHIISVRVDKDKSADPFEKAWTALIQRFENTLKFQNFPDAAFKYDSGAIVADDTDVKKLTGLLRKMRRINNVPNMSSKFVSGSRNIPLTLIIKDPVFRPSNNSYFLQMVDVVAYFVKQYYSPNSQIKKRKGKDWYGKLEPIINKKATLKTSNYKIIDL